ncbi:MAG: fasciclin domain-containing protein [Bacteroidaceae bacterium]|nr:fasciclin domain-containing protein [Bacteroidaceae bacterium]
MRKYLLFLILAGLIVACKEDIDMNNRYVFREHTIVGYLADKPEYTDYLDLIYRVRISPRSQSTVGQLLSARGHYTCFAPTNQAIQIYLDSLVRQGLIERPSFEAFTDSFRLDSIREVIVKNSIIDGGDHIIYETGTFPREKGEFELTNMKDHKLSVHYGANPDSIYINTTNLIDLRNRDISCSNGVIHQMHQVITPSEQSLGQILQECADGLRSDYRVMGTLARACGLLDTLDKRRDEAYELAYLTGEVTDYPANGLASTMDGRCYVPEHRRYGFTLFAEPDAFWEEQLGLYASDITPDDIQRWLADHDILPDAQPGQNYHDPQNLLNQFVTYHFLPMRIPNNRLVFHNNERGFRIGTGSAYTIPVMEHYTTMGLPRLLKIYQSNETSRMPYPDLSSGIYLNRFPQLDNGRQGSGVELSCAPDRRGCLIHDVPENLGEFSAVNGIIYPIDGLLAYTDEVRTALGSSRIRFDVMSFFPEVMNNDIRQSTVGSAQTQCVAFPQDNVYKYLDNVSINENTLTFCYFNAYRWNWNNYQGDELKGVGYYDYTFRLPPVPKRGTYEIRYKVLANSDRGVCQIYFGTDPGNLVIAGIPMDLTIGGLIHYSSSGERPSISGWLEDTEDDEYNALIDKKMRNNGFMKGPVSYWDGSITSRQQHWNVRRIIVRQTMDPSEQYYLRFRSCIESYTKEFYIDYIEYCPKEVYDNPMQPEDIW